MAGLHAGQAAAAECDSVARYSGILTRRNLFDALDEAEDRLSRIEGHKYIILIASGRDTFSKLTLDKIYQKVKTTPDITIFAISTGGALRAMTEGGPGMGQQMRDIDYLQADNEMKTFAKMTGGMWFSPRFVAEMPDIFSDINKAIRSKYELVYLQARDAVQPSPRQPVLRGGLVPRTKS